MQTDQIRIKTSIPQGFVVAGRPFSLTTTVTNLEDRPIAVISYSYHIPFQVQWINDRIFDQEFEKARTHVFSKWLGNYRSLKAAASSPGAIMMYANASTAGGTLHTVSPGGSQSYTFRAIMPQWLFLTGGQLTFQGHLTYQVDNDTRTATFEVTVPFRPPLKAIALGATSGALLGTAAKALREHGALLVDRQVHEVIAAAVLAVILSTIAVVYTCRRSNEAQPVLTVEDVWGGMILGFLIGYLGHEFFQKLVPVG